MSKIETYQQAVANILEEFASHKPATKESTENQIITDLRRNHFQLIRLGWENEDDESFVYQLIFHFDIKPDGKIWIHANWTDTDIAAELVEWGVDKSDIVLGFQPPSHRQYTGYAVA